MKATKAEAREPIVACMLTADAASRDIGYCPFSRNNLKQTPKVGTLCTQAPPAKTIKWAAIAIGHIWGPLSEVVTDSGGNSLLAHSELSWQSGLASYDGPVDRIDDPGYMSRTFRKFRTD